MGISVEGQKCPICNGYVFDNDDLVFCPKCGAPHHRDCYAAVGNCGLADKHDTAEQYDRSNFAKIEYKQATTESNSSNQSQNPNPQASQPVKETVDCQNCGEEVPNGGPYCPFCGTQVSQTVRTPFGVATIPDPLGGLSPDDKIDDVPVSEAAAFIGVATARYLPRFKEMGDKKKKSWNWAAFFFPNAWFFYRKMYLPGFCFFIISLVLSAMILLPFYQIIATIAEEDRTTTQALVQYLMVNWQAINPTSIFVMAGACLAKLILHFVSGFVGDSIYRESVLDKIREIKTALEEDDEDIPLALVLRNKGGVNLFLGLFGIMALQWGSTLLLSII